MLATVPQAIVVPEDRSESSLSQVAEKFRVVLFGIGKTVHAPPDQPALQVLLQYRNLYELALRDINIRSEARESIPESVYNRVVMMLDRMWGIIIECMREHNKSMANRAKLLSAEKMAVMRIAPPAYTVPNPGFTKVPDAPAMPSTPQVPDDLVVLDPEEPHV